VIGQYVLGLKKDARLELTQSGLEIKGKVALLGKQLKDRQRGVPHRRSGGGGARPFATPVFLSTQASLRCSSAPTPGVSFVSWGVQSASPRLLGYGILALVLGVVVDFVLVSLLPGARGRCRMVVTPKSGQQVCVAGLDIQGADRPARRSSRRLA